MKEQKVDGKGLTAKELQDIIDTAVIRRNKPTEYLLEDLERALLLAVELIPEFGKRALEAIRKKHPDLFDDMTS